MNEFAAWYLSVASAIYLICFARDAVSGFKAFRKATVMDVIRGVIGALIWPYLAWIADYSEGQGE